jgi:hypothetical protein
MAVEGSAEEEARTAGRSDIGRCGHLVGRRSLGSHVVIGNRHVGC